MLHMVCVRRLFIIHQIKIFILKNEMNKCEFESKVVGLFFASTFEGGPSTF